jgi:sugar phosphate isomerase/epimerase
LDVVQRQGLRMLFHNDDIHREAAEILVGIIQQLGREHTGACPDFGNFATKSPEYALAQLRMLAPYASNICHAKDGIAQGGKFYPDDFAGSMRVMREAGFNGLYSMEFEGLGDPIQGVRHLMELTGQYLR